MVEQKIKLPSSSYPELIKIIQAYNSFNEPKPPKEVASILGTHDTVVSANNGFLLTINIIEGGNKKKLTLKGKKLANALSHDYQDEVCSIWSELVTNNEFLSKILSAIRIRKSMDKSTLQSHIAYSAGLPKKNYILTGAGTIIEIFKVSNLLIEDDGKLVLSHAKPVSSIISDTTIYQEHESKYEFEKKDIKVKVEDKTHPINIQIQIQCTPSDIEGLGVKLQKMFKELNTNIISEEDK